VVCTEVVLYRNGPVPKWAKTGVRFRFIHTQATDDFLVVCCSQGDVVNKVTQNAPKCTILRAKNQKIFRPQPQWGPTPSWPPVTRPLPPPLLSPTNTTLGTLTVNSAPSRGRTSESDRQPTGLPRLRSAVADYAASACITGVN